MNEYAKLWSLGEDFSEWIESENIFCNTLVDRIVTGYPKEEAQRLFSEIGYTDKLLDTAEPYHLWVIEGNYENELPLQKAGLNIIWTNDVKPYKKLKVRILNGSHTSLVFPSMLCGAQTVKESLEDKYLSAFLNTCLFDYILPTLGDTEENRRFANATLERFSNPYIKHMWKSISLNSVSKFTARVLPTTTDYIDKNNALPKPLLFSLAGHDHMNNFSVNYHGIRLTYGLSCDHNIYFVPFRGGTLINIKDDGSFTTQALIRHRGQSNITVCKEK